MNYKPLATPLIKNGFEHTQLFRDGDVAIFHKVHLNPHFDAGFETVVISRHDGYEMGGVQIEPAECYPSPEMWGTRGWTFTNLLAARKKFTNLLMGVPDADGVAIPEADEAPIADLTTSSVKSSSVKDLLIPVGEFKIGQLAEFNKVNYSDAYLFVKANLNTKVKFLRQDTEHKGKGKKPSIYSGV
jgi:hypothetical protein